MLLTGCRSVCSSIPSNRLIDAFEGIVQVEAGAGGRRQALPTEEVGQVMRMEIAKREGEHTPLQWGGPTMRPPGRAETRSIA